MILNTYNNGTTESWEIGSLTIIPIGIVQKIRDKHINLIDSKNGVKIKLANKIHEIGDFVVLENDKLSVLTKIEFNQKYVQDRIEAQDEN